MTELVASGTNAIGRESKLLPKVWQNSSMTMHRHKPGLFAGVLAFLFATSAWSQSATSYPDMPIDAQTMRVHEQAEEVYERADYKRAFFIYRKELAPMGDKYGQYMVGFMYRTGQGVEEDQVAASAWYRLAAERGTPEFVGARDEVMQSLDAGQRSESDSQFVELRKRYGDLVLLTRAIREDHQLLQSKSSSTGDAGDGSINAMGLSNPTAAAAETSQRIKRRIGARLGYIGKHTDIDVEEFDVDALDLEELERQVNAELSQLP